MFKWILFCDFVDAGTQALSRGDVVLARQAYESAVAFAEKRYGATSTPAVLPLWCLAKAYRTDQYGGRNVWTSRAVAAGERALLILESRVPVDNLELETFLTFHATSLWLDESFERAVFILKWALNLRKRRTEDIREQLGALVEILLLSLNLPGEALPFARELAVLDEKLENRPAFSHYQFLLADCLRRVGPPEEARTYLQRFLQRAAEPGTSDEELNATAQQWLQALL